MCLLYGLSYHPRAVSRTSATVEEGRPSALSGNPSARPVIRRLSAVTRDLSGAYSPSATSSSRIALIAGIVWEWMSSADSGDTNGWYEWAGSSGGARNIAIMG
jgi:hypothetical protein